MTVISRAAFYVALGATAPALALDSARLLTQYGHDGWNYQNGLPGGAVYDVTQLSDGYIWLRSASGLVRFDGVRFVPITPTVDNRPVTENIRAISRTNSGKLLLRGPSRTLFLQNGAFADAVLPARLPDGTERVICHGSDGTVWLGSDCNVCRIKQGKISVAIGGTGWVSAIIEDREGAVWIGSAAGVFRFKNERITLFPTGYNSTVEETFFPTERINDGVRLRSSVTSLLQDRRGTLWIGTHNGLFKLTDGHLVKDAETDALGSVHVAALLEDRDGNLWVGTDGKGLYRHTQGTWNQFSTANGLSDDAICSLLEDVEGSLWIGTRAGLDRLRNTPLLTIGVKEGLSHDDASAITQTADGSVFVYTAGGGITRVKDGQCTQIGARDGLPNDYAGTLYPASDGTLWIGTDLGLCSYRDGRISQYSGSKSLEGFSITAINEDDQGLVVATNKLLLYRFKGGVLSPYDLPLPSGRQKESIRYVFAMQRDDEGTLWIGMTAGLYRVPKGLSPTNAERSAFTVPTHSIYDDGKGSLWLTGADTPGFARLYKKEDRVVYYGPDAGIPSGEISRILTDRHDNLWMGTRIGIISISRQEADDYAAGHIAKVHPRVYGIVDGMKTEEAAGDDRQPSAWRGQDGRLYFGSRKGLVVLDPDRLPRNARIPPVVIEDFLVDQQKQPGGPDLELAPGKENLEFRYTALSLLAPSRVQFKYRLSGYDADWVDAGSRRTAYYTHLPPGSYRFQVIACNEDGAWNETGASFAFTLQPHFYQTNWFYLVCAGALALLGHGIHWARTRTLRRRQAELVALVDERTGTLRNEVNERTQAQQELQRYRDYLEQVVAQRTLALRESNEKLQKEIAERRSGEEALRASEDRYRRFFEEDLAGSFIANRAGELVTCNPAFARLFGFLQRKDAVGLDLAELFQRPAATAELLARVEGEGKVQDCELELKRRDGRPLYVLANIIGSFDPAGQLIEIKGFLVDTTDRMRLENQLRQAQKMEAVGQLAGGVAHDFNNLLTAIIGSSECLIEDAIDDPETMVLATEIRDAGRRAAALTRQLLAFSRKQVLQPKVFDLNEVVADMDKLLRRLIGEDVHLEQILSSDLLRARADPNQIEQIIVNLTVNARDALAGGGRLTIGTLNAVVKEPIHQGNQIVPPGRYVCLEVSDSGCGMSEEVQARIFEPFFTTKGPGKGSGLGLSTVYGIVQQSNGHITFVSKVGQGTTFRVYLPAVDLPLDTDKSTAPQRSVPARLNCEKILLVEDNEPVLKIARRGLEHAGFSVLDASNADDAIQRCREENGAIDLLVTDVIMPGMNGRELAEKLVAEYPSIKVLFISGYTDDALVRVGGLTNVVLLEKPFTPDSLVRRVREVLDGKAELSQRQIGTSAVERILVTDIST